MDRLPEIKSSLLQDRKAGGLGYAEICDEHNLSLYKSHQV